MVLLSNEVFRRKDPKREPGWILQDWSDGGSLVVPVTFGLTVKGCAELAKEAGLGGGHFRVAARE